MRAGSTAAGPVGRGGAGSLRAVTADPAVLAESGGAVRTGRRNRLPKVPRSHAPHSRLARPAFGAQTHGACGGGPARRAGALGARQRAGRPRSVHGGRRTPPHHRHQPRRREPRSDASVRAPAGRRRSRRARLRGGRQLRRGAAAADRRRRRGGTAAPRGPAPHRLPRHRQGRLLGDRRRPVPGRDGGLRGPARSHQGRTRRRGARRTSQPARRPGRRLGRAVRRLRRRRGRRPRLGGPQSGPAHPRCGTPARPPHPGERRRR